MTNPQDKVRGLSEDTLARLMVAAEMYELYGRFTSLAELVVSDKDRRAAKFICVRLSATPPAEPSAQSVAELLRDHLGDSIPTRCGKTTPEAIAELLATYPAVEQVSESELAAIIDPISAKFYDRNNQPTADRIDLSVARAWSLALEKARAILTRFGSRLVNEP